MVFTRASSLKKKRFIPQLIILDNPLTSVSTVVENSSSKNYLQRGHDLTRTLFLERHIGKYYKSNFSMRHRQSSINLCCIGVVAETS